MIYRLSRSCDDYRQCDDQDWSLLGRCFESVDRLLPTSKCRADKEGKPNIGTQLSSHLFS